MKKLLIILLLLPFGAIAGDGESAKSLQEQSNSAATGTIAYDRGCSGTGIAQGMHTRITTAVSGVGSAITIVTDNATSGVPATKSWTKTIDTSVANVTDITCATKLP